MKIRPLLLACIAVLVAAAGGWYAGQARRPAPAPAAQGAAPATSPPGTPATPKSASATPAAPAPAAPLEFAETDLLVLAPTRVMRGIPITGTLKPADQGLVRAKVAGELRELKVREGQTVSAGQTIARVDPTEFEARVVEREAQVRSAQAQLDQAQRALAHNTQLFERGFISRSALDNAGSALDAAVGARDAAQAQLASARKSLADTAVVSPIAGVVAERFVQPGEKVSADTRIVSVIDLSRLEVEAQVPAAEIGAVRIGQQVALRIEGQAGPREGRVLRMGPTTTAGTRSIPIYIGLDNRGAVLRAGLFAQGTLALQAREGVIAVPETALRERAGRSFVYAIENGAVVEKDVVTGLRDAASTTGAGPEQIASRTGLIEITRGLAAGDRIVAVDLGSLRAGAPALVRPPRAAAPPAAAAAARAPAAPAAPAAR
jgi:RND family efflux transporter MFP subunit